MGNLLRDRRTASEWAASGQTIEFSEKINSFKRLAGIVENDLEALDPDKLPPDWRDNVVAGQLSFGFAAAHGGVAALDGRVSATIDAVCQRCLESFRVPLEAELRLLFAGDKSAPDDDDGHEHWELDEEKLRPLDIVEEALIMAMPLTAMHVDDEICREPDAAEIDSGEKIRPFAMLKSQMEDED